MRMKDLPDAAGAVIQEKKLKLCSWRSRYSKRMRVASGECAENGKRGDNHRRAIVCGESAADELEQPWELGEREVGGLGYLGVGSAEHRTLTLADGDGRLENEGQLGFARATDGGMDGLETLGFRETEVGENFQQQSCIKVADIAHVVGQGEIDGIAFALDSATGIACGNQELVDDGGVGDAAIGWIGYG